MFECLSQGRRISRNVTNSLDEQRSTSVRFNIGLDTDWNGIHHSPYKTQVKWTFRTHFCYDDHTSRSNAYDSVSVWLNKNISSETQGRVTFLTPFRNSRKKTNHTTSRWWSHSNPSNPLFQSDDSDWGLLFNPFFEISEKKQSFFVLNTTSIWWSHSKPCTPISMRLKPVTIKGVLKYYSPEGLAFLCASFITGILPLFARFEFNVEILLQSTSFPCLTISGWR